MQLIGLFLLFLVAFSVVAGVYLSVSAKAAAVGRDIQAKQKLIETYDREIEDRESRLAEILSSKEMEDRARRLGFQPIQPDQIVYMKVPGYAEDPVVVLAPSTPPSLASAPMVPPQYTESLFTWIDRKLSSNSMVFSGALP